MNFFAEQDKARRNTTWLVALFLLAVVCLIILTVIVVGMIMYFAQQPTDSPRLVETMNTQLGAHFKNLLQSEMVYWASAGVLVVIIGGSLYKLMALGGSGIKVAEALGGKRIQPNTNDYDEKKVLNVVEEMAIASGNPVPVVFILEEDSINAFAAGTDRRNAVIGVTRGCIQRLSRDELQGVIAHEFSHIHFGDMKLNLRLVAILHGILIIGLIGSYMLRSGSYRYGYSSYNSRSKNRSGLMGAGLALVVLGYLGVFFGNIIKAAVSRQREYLADASAVQFTRNPQGIANALKKIGGASSTIEAPAASEFSHFYFGQGIKPFFGSLMATHPPLGNRIKKIEPRWNGQFLKSTQQSDAPAQEQSAAPKHDTSAHGAMGFSAGFATAVENVGNLTPENIQSARQLIDSLPKSIYEAAHDPFSARALIYAILLDKDSEKVRNKQREQLKKGAHPATYKALTNLEKECQKLARATYLEVIELSMPAIKSQSELQYKVFKKNLIELVRADGKISLLEWCLYRMITQGYEGKSSSGNKSLSSLANETSVLLSAMCYAGKTEKTTELSHALEENLPGLKIKLEGASGISFQELDQAIKKLDALKPLEKPKLLKALAACIHFDKQVLPEELELFRAVADSINCPIPLPSLEA